MSKTDSSPSQTTTTIMPVRFRGERGSGTTITIDLVDQPELLAKIREAAKADDREPSKWIRRRIVQLGDTLFESTKEDVPAPISRHQARDEKGDIFT